MSDPIPSEFRYWENLPTFRGQLLKRSLQVVFGVDPQLPDDIVRQYACSYYDADPVAEAFVAEAEPSGPTQRRQWVEQALTHGVDSVYDAPPSLRPSMRRLFGELETTPSWVDLQLVERGASVFRRFGTHMYSFAGAITLEGYRESSVAKPLAFTGAYNGDSANRRFLETASFWIDVSEPGGLAAGQRGRATALRVRLMHVHVRSRLVAHPKWNLQAWGVPISQGDALLTLMGGSFVPGYGLKVLGYRTSREEIEAMIHFWRYVGYLMGVQPRWFPTTVDQALGLMFTAHLKGAGLSGQDGTNLAQSYLASYRPTPQDSFAESLQKWFEYGLQRGYTSWFLPPQTFRQFRLPSPGLWRLHPLVQAPFIFARETLRKNSVLASDWLDERARAETKTWVKKRLGARTANYQAVETFTR